MEKQSLYPPNPKGVPADLTQPTSDYRFQLSMILLSLVLFFLLYFGLMAFCVFVLAMTVYAAVARSGGAVLVAGIILSLPCLLLFIYMVKNLFRWGGKDKNSYVEIHEHEHPKLFDFIRRTCDDTGAPYPKRVYVSYEVNAAAFNDGNAVWHLFLPAEKNLLLGLGLVNAINLTEFKALLAHEFGHFSQKSSRVGGYVYHAVQIVEQVVYGRDWFDNFIDGWCRTDPRVAWPAWIFWAILWVLRRVLIGLRYAIAFFHFGLSRQMEFNADLMAVSVAGSDAPVHLLSRSMFADRCMGQAITDLQTAMDHHLYTSDLFYHHSQAVAFVRRKEKDPRLGEPPPLPDEPEETTQVFEPDDDEQAAMWQTHPSNYDREQNAKAHYIRSAFDERSPWMLFDDVREVRERVTYKFYRFYFKVPKDVVLAEPEEIHAFLEEERAETTYDAKYQGLYDYRNLVLGDVYELAKDARKTPWSIGELASTYKTLYNVEVKHRAQLYNKRLEEFNLLAAVSRGWHKPKNDEIDFRGEIYDAKDAKRLLKKVEKELNKENEWLGEVDRRVFMTHFQMALHLNQEVAEDLFKRYRFHLELQTVWKELKDQEAPVGAAVNFLQNLTSNQLDPGAFQEALQIFREAHHALRDSLRASEAMLIPPLKNMPAGQPLRSFLLEKKLVEGLSKYEQSLDAKWIDKMLKQMREVQTKVDRIHFKSLGGILALQQRVADECLKRWGNLPAASPITP